MTSLAERVYLEPKDIEMLENAAGNLRDKLLLRILFYSGCRVSEVLGITKTYIDFQNSTITIEHLKIRTQLCCPQCNTRLNKRSVFCSNCGSKVETIVSQEKERRRIRTLPIDEDTLAMLREYIYRKGPVFRGGKRFIFGVSRFGAYKIIRQCAEKAGLPQLTNPETGKTHNVSPHRLRDAFAVHAVKLDDSGDGLRMLQEHLGHQSFNTTAKYRKVSGQEHREWYDKLFKEGKQ